MSINETLFGVGVTLDESLKTRGKNMLTRVRWFKAVWILPLLLVVAASGVAVPRAQASLFTGVTPVAGNTPSSLFDVDSVTGLATNLRTTANGLIGIAADPDDPDRLFGVSVTATLSTIDRLTGAATFSSTGLGFGLIAEGDVAFDPTSGTLFGVGRLGFLVSDPDSLFTLDTATGAGTVVGLTTIGDASAMAFDDAGNLFILDTDADTLVQVNKSDGSTISSVVLSLTLSSIAGMDFDASGTLFVGDSVTNDLYTLDTNTGVLSVVGTAGTAPNLGGLTFVVPEPAIFSLLGLAGVWLLRRRR